MEPIKLTIDETVLAGAVCSLKAAVKGRRVRSIKCYLSKTRLKIDCGSWGAVVIPVVSERGARFQISNQSLSRMAVCYRGYKGGRANAPAVLDKEKQFFKTLETWVSIQ